MSVPDIDTPAYASILARFAYIYAWRAFECKVRASVCPSPRVARLLQRDRRHAEAEVRGIADRLIAAGFPAA